MNAFSRQDLKALMEKRQGPCVSIYQPTHRPAAHTEQDRIRFKNLLAQAEERLIRAGLRRPVARDLLAPGQELMSDGLFWQHQGDGLAVFLAQEMDRCYCLPLPLDECVFVGDRFHVIPLVPLLTGDGRFYVLAISQNEIRLLQGTRYGVVEVDLQDLPRRLAEVLKPDDVEKQLQWHTRTPQRGSRRAAMFHGHGGGVDDAKDRLLRYFRRIDAGLRDFLGNERVPLVLAGVEYHFPIYRQANSYPHLAQDGVAGNPDGQHAKELHRQAWHIVRPLFQKARLDTLELFWQLAREERTSTELTKVLAAAHQGRVESLFVNAGARQWGTFDADRGTVQVHDRQFRGDDDLLDLACVHTLSNDGTVYAVDEQEMPDETSVAAVLRY